MQITMMNRHEPYYSAMLNNLTREVFGFSFAPWQQAGQWDARYESYSVIEDGRMLSNLCLFKAELLVSGKHMTALQLGAVATRESWRGRGLSRTLMEHVIALYPDTPMYLFANQSVLGFYPKFGFERKAKWRLTLEAGDEPGAPVPAGYLSFGAAAPRSPDDTFAHGSSVPPPARRIPATDARVMKALAVRGARSALLDTRSADPVAVFHLIMDYPDDVYYLPGLDVVTVARLEGDTLSLIDIIARAPLPFAAVISALQFRGYRRLEFGFCPDWLGVKPRCEAVDDDNDALFLKGVWTLNDGFVFPAMGIT